MQLSMPLRRPPSERLVRSATARRLHHIQPGMVRVLLVGLVLVAQAVTLGVVWKRSGTVNENAARVHASTELLRNAASIRRQVQLITQPAQLAVLSFSDSMRRGLLASDDAGQIERYLIAQLQASADLSVLNYGTTDGSLIMASRHDDRFETRHTRLINSLGDAMRQVTDHALDGRKLQDQPVALVRFDSRSRPWYSAAIDQDRAVWSRPMVYGRLDRTGVQISHRVRDAAGNVRGVVSAVIDRRTLDRSIERAEVPHPIRAALATRDGSIIGASAGVIRSQADARVVPTIDDIAQPELRALLNRTWASLELVLASDNPLQQSADDGRPHVGLVGSLRQFGDGPPWIVALSAPTDVIESDLKRTGIGDSVGRLAAPLLLPLFGTLAVLLMMRPILRIHRQATTDSLTGLLNRSFFIGRLDARLNRMRRGQQADTEIMVIVLDLDGFKPVNDRHGHASGDRILETMARRLTRSVRAGDLIARMGGDEFVVAMQVNRHDDLEALGERLLTRITSMPVRHRDSRFPIQATAGFATPGPGETAESLIRRADIALIRGKAIARGRIHAAA